MSIVLSTMFVLYAAFVGILIAGWRKSGRSVIPDLASQAFQPFVTVIIPARNEAANIASLLNDLSKQSHNAYEVIVVDDHSEDDTMKVVSSHILMDSRFKLIIGIGHGKKASITQAIEQARGTIVITTDADCRVSKDWIQRMGQYFMDDDIAMVFGGVRMESNSFFGSLQALEFASLIGSGAAASAFGKPFLCNGANLAFRREVFNAVSGYRGNLNVPSGDDEFLMRKVASTYPGGVRFVHETSTVVSTAPNRSINELISQRIRWAGKWNLHTDPVGKVVALFVFMFQVSTLILFALTISRYINTTLALALFSIKIVAEMIFFQQLVVFFKIRRSVRSFLLLQLMYPVYVCYVAIVCNFKSFEWKGRILSSSPVKNSGVQRLNQ